MEGFVFRYSKKPAVLFPRILSHDGWTSHSENSDSRENSNLALLQLEAYVCVIKDNIQQFLGSFYYFHPNK